MGLLMIFGVALFIVGTILKSQQASNMDAGVSPPPNPGPNPVHHVTRDFTLDRGRFRLTTERPPLPCDRPKHGYATISVETLCAIDPAACESYKSKISSEKSVLPCDHPEHGYATIPIETLCAVDPVACEQYKSIMPPEKNQRRRFKFQRREIPEEIEIDATDEVIDLTPDFDNEAIFVLTKPGEKHLEALKKFASGMMDIEFDELAVKYGHTDEYTSEEIQELFQDYLRNKGIKFFKEHGNKDGKLMAKVLNKMLNQ